MVHTATVTHAENRTLRVRSGDVELAVRVRGVSDAPTLILVHGYPDNSTIWDPVIPGLVGHFRVVTYDVRGAGDSDRPRRVRDYSLRRLREDLHAVMDAVSPDRRVHVAGHDWGSIQSWESATEPGADARIASFTSISGPCLDHVGLWMRRQFGRLSPRGMVNALRQFSHSWYIMAFQLPWAAPALWKWHLGKAWSGLLRRVEHVPAHRNPTQTEDGIDGIKLYRANFVPRLLNPRRRPAQVPVQLIVPTLDRYVTPQMMRSLDEWMPTLWRRELPASHWLQYTHGSQLATWLTDFVMHIEGRDASTSLAAARVR